MTLKLQLSLGLFCAIALLSVGCGSEENAADPPAADPPSPERIAAEANPDLAAQAAQESVKQMLALAKDGAWDAFIYGYYGEVEKIENDDQMEQLRQRFEKQWGAQLIPVLEKAAEITPVIEAGKAKFQVEGETIYELHLGDEGRWGFHL